MGGGRGRALGLEVVAVQRLMGTVVSTKADKTVTVQVERKTKHPKYGKFVVSTKNYLVHDGEEEARMGDYVRIAACRPLSKHKKFTLSEILKRKNIAEEFLEKEEVDLS